MSALAVPPVEPGGWTRWVDRFAAWRDRTVADPRFQRVAAALPLTGWIARRRAAALFDLVAGFVYTQVLLSCVRLKLFDLLAEGPLTAAQIAPRIALNEAATQRLLAAAVSLRLLEHRGHGRIGLGALGAPLVGHAALNAMIEHHAALYADLRDPVALLRGESGPRALAAYWPYAEHQPVGAGTPPATPDGETAARLGFCASVLRLHGRLRRAMALLEWLDAARPGDFLTAKRLADACFAAGNRKAGWRWLDLAQARAPQNALLLLSCAIRAAEQGDETRAAEAMAAAGTAWPGLALERSVRRASRGHLPAKS